LIAEDNKKDFISAQHINNYRCKCNNNSYARNIKKNK